VLGVSFSAPFGIKNKAFIKVYCCFGLSLMRQHDLIFEQMLSFSKVVRP